MHKECNVIFTNANNGDPIFNVKIVENGEVYGPMKIGELTKFLKTKYDQKRKMFLFSEFNPNAELTLDYLRIGLNKAADLFILNNLENIKKVFLNSVKENLKNEGIKLDD